MTLYYVLSALVNAVASTILGFWVLSINKKNRVNQAFAWFCFAVAIWSWAYCFWPIALDKESILFWFRILHIGAILIPIAYLHFVLTFLEIDRKKLVLLVFGYLAAAVFLAVDFTPLFIADMVPKFSFDYWAVPGPFYHFFLLFFFASTIYCWYLLYGEIKITTGARQMQTKYILAGTLIGFIGGSTNYFLWYNIPIPPYGNGLVVFFILLTAIAVVKYHLFEVKLIITELLVGLMGILLLVLTLLMPSNEAKAMAAVVFAMFLIFAFFLIKAIQQENKSREEAERIAIREHALREEAEQVAANLKTLDRAKTQFMMSTQHHLRSPLTVIQGYLSLIEEGSYGKVNKKVAAKVHVSLGEAQKLIKVVNDLLDMAKYQMNINVTERQSTDIVAILRDVSADLVETARKKNLKLEYVDQVILPPVAINAKSMREAIYNIVDNAIKYTDEGGVTMSAHSTGKNILVSIADTGIGMEEVDRLGLFKKTFQRGDAAKAINTTGKGIGLYLAGQMVLANGGNIWVMSKGRGFGTTFFIELPISDIDLFAKPGINATKTNIDNKSNGTSNSAIQPKGN